MSESRTAFFLYNSIRSRPSIDLTHHFLEISRFQVADKLVEKAFLAAYGLPPKGFRDLKLLEWKLWSLEKEWLFRGVSAADSERALEDGLTHSTHWGTSSIASYFAEEAASNGKGYAILAAPRSAFDVTMLRPDLAMIEEPITAALEATERQVRAKWAASKAKDWKASLRIGGAVIYEGTILAENLVALVVPADIIRLVGMPAPGNEEAPTLLAPSRR